ncbi:hypothetical protein [Salinigranum salinum]|nr:hypothetical protein [Salinigranum salinum]
MNETDDEVHTWVMVGAPPTGTVDDSDASALPDEVDGDVPSEEG